MTIYAIGDIQGCFDALQALLQKIQFNPEHDVLWCVGDLVNRGPKSLETLRFLKSLGSRAKVVLGNHDLHLLAVHFKVMKSFPDDTIQDILAAPDREKLIDWLRKQPLVYTDDTSPYVMVHAGFCPSWTLPQALAFSDEVSSVLQGPEIKNYLSDMHGNQPDIWSDDLEGPARLRVITNYCTRMRFCTAEGRLILDKKTALPDCPTGALPWFTAPNRAIQAPILFGHWSALQGETHTPNVFALDTGIVWGGSLTAMRLTDCKRFSYKA